MSSVDNSAGTVSTASSGVGSILDTAKEWASNNQGLLTALLAGGALGGVATSLMGSKDPDETSEERTKRRLKNLAMGVGGGALAAGGLAYGMDALGDAVSPDPTTTPAPAPSTIESTWEALKDVGLGTSIGGASAGTAGATIGLAKHVRDKRALETAKNLVRSVTYNPTPSSRKVVAIRKAVSDLDKLGVSKDAIKAVNKALRAANPKDITDKATKLTGALEDVLGKDIARGLIDKLNTIESDAVKLHNRTSLRRSLTSIFGRDLKFGSKKIRNTLGKKLGLALADKVSSIPTLFSSIKSVPANTANSKLLGSLWRRGGKWGTILGALGGGIGAGVSALSDED